MSRFYRDIVVWVTGASSGIGEALVHEAARRGARVVLSARRASVLEEVRSAAALDDDRSRVVPVDLADVRSLDARAAEAWDAFGTIDVMIHNAGVSQRGRCLDTVHDVDRHIMQVNALSPIALTKVIAPRMIARGGGHVAVVSSVLGKMAVPGYSAYCASKHAVQGFFEALRAEEYDRGLRVTMICPGWVVTNVSKNALTEDGTPRGTMDVRTSRGIPAATCARKTLDAIAAERGEALIGGIECQAVRVKRFFPGLFSRIVRGRPVPK